MSTTPKTPRKDGDEAAPESLNEDTLDWNGPTDPNNPMNWSPTHKWMTIALVTAITLICASSSYILAPALPFLLKDFNSNSQVLANFTVSEYIIGYCIGPLLLAPLSELYGRSPVIHASNVLFVIFSMACAVSSSLTMLIVFRLGMGFCGCATITLGGGYVADLMPVERRGRALAFWTMGPSIGPMLSPIIGGLLAQQTSWRWIFWLITICAGFLSIASFVFLKETYAPVILARRAERRRKENGGIQPASPSLARTLKKATVRPAKMLIRSPIVAILAFYNSIVISYINLISTTFAGIFETRYGFTASQSGLTYLGLAVGFAIGQLAVAIFTDRYIQRKKADYNEAKPEHRLPPLILGGLIVPAGFFWYGWSAEYGSQWILPILGTALYGIGAMFSFLPVQMYLVDAFTVFAASAIAANVVVRSLFAAVIPLGAPRLYAELGIGWGNSLFAFIALAFYPVPFLLIRYGERIRTNPRFQVAF